MLRFGLALLLGFCLWTWVAAAPPKDRSVVQLAWSENGAVLAVGGADGEVSLWSSDARRLKLLPRQVGEIRALAWVRGELMSLSSDGTVRASARLDPLINLGYVAQAVAGGRRWAVFGFQGLQIYDLESQKVVSKVQMTLDEKAEYAFQGDFLSIREEDGCTLVSAETGLPLQKIALSRRVSGQAFGPHPSLWFNTGSALQEYSLPKGELLGEGPAPPDVDRKLLLGEPLEFLAEGRRMGFEGGQLRVWTASGEKYLFQDLPSKYSGVYALNPARSEVALGLRDGTIRVLPVCRR